MSLIRAFRVSFKGHHLSKIFKSAFFENPLDLYRDLPYNTYINSPDDMFEEALVDHSSIIFKNSYVHSFIAEQYEIIGSLSGNTLIKSIKDGEIKTHFGDVFTFKSGQYHSYNDMPAMIRNNGLMAWYQSVNPDFIMPEYNFNVQQSLEYRFNRGFTQGVLHRDNDKPAIITHNFLEWNQYGKIHRDGDLPAVIYNNNYSGYKMWCKQGMTHRDNDLPALICSDGTQIWYQNNKIHREDSKPAIIYLNGNKEWYINDKCYKVLAKQDESPYFGRPMNGEYFEMVKIEN